MRGQALTEEDTNTQGYGSARETLEQQHKKHRRTTRENTVHSEPCEITTKPDTNVERELEIDKIRTISLSKLRRLHPKFMTLHALAKALESETDFAWTQREVWQWLKQPEQDPLKDDPTFEYVYLEALRKRP